VVGRLDDKAIVVVIVLSLNYDHVDLVDNDVICCSFDIARTPARL